MDTYSRTLAVAALALSLSACGDIPYRKAGLKDDPACRIVFQQYDQLNAGAGPIPAPLEASPCWRQANEEHVDYDLFTVEFDDQGWLQGTSGKDRPKRDHIDQVYGSIGDIYNQNQKNGLAVVVYVHGWHHNADANDADVREFRLFLRNMAYAERGRRLDGDPAKLGAPVRTYVGGGPEGPRVVGIYVGWRGESIPLEGANVLTFWERKNTAERVAQGSVRELFERLDYVRDCARTKFDWRTLQDRSAIENAATGQEQGKRNVRMLTIGHSFGGLITFEALSSQLIRTGVRATPDRYLSRVGDLIVIVNPAFEGARYEPVMAIGQRLRGVRNDQYPIAIIATSEGDVATKNAFPIARALNTFWESQPGEEFAASVKAVGHNNRYITHDLDVCEGEAQCNRTCDAAAAELQKSAPAEEQEILREQGLMKKFVDEKKSFEDENTYLCRSLVLKRRVEVQLPLNPFWVVHTTAKVIKDHGDIFNPNFVSFFRQMYLAIINARFTSESKTPNDALSTQCTGEVAPEPQEK